MSTQVLLTGFEPFGGDSQNPSWLACSALHGVQIEGFSVRSLCLPTAFNAAALKLLRDIARHNPVLVIATGVAGGRSEITPERFALNFAITGDRHLNNWKIRTAHICAYRSKHSLGSRCEG